MEKLDRWSRYACFGCWRSVTLQMCYCDKHLVELICFLLWWAWGLGTDPFNQATTPGGGSHSGFLPQKRACCQGRDQGPRRDHSLVLNRFPRAVTGIACWQQWFARDTRGKHSCIPCDTYPDYGRVLKLYGQLDLNFILKYFHYLFER